jgi:hypothetical protein
MKNIKYHLASLLIFMSMGFFSNVAQSALVTTSFTGTVTADNGGVNPFGLTNGGSISGSVIYDDAVVIGTDANEVVSGISGRSGWNFSFTLGSFTFTQANVTDSTYTDFFFNMGKFDGVRFYIEPTTIGSFSNLQIEDYDGGRKLFVEDSTTGNPVYLEASWNFASGSTPVPVTTVGSVPEPSVLWLLGIGLIGFIVMRKTGVINRNSLTGNLFA